MKNKNRLDVRLDPESQELLNSLLARTNLTKTSLIKKALVVYASCLTNGHVFTIKYKSKKEPTEKPSNVDNSYLDDISFDEIVDDLDK